MNYHHPYQLTPPDSTVDPNFSHFGEDADFAAALANWQPCHDCTPATKTTIPHHHHPSGRLPGASATLDGHFCCSWLVHEDQPCFLCFESPEALDNHIKNDHAGKDGTYRCFWQNCSKHDKAQQINTFINFSNKPKLMRHVHSHTGYKPFPCPFPDCDKGFVTKEQLKNHETTHTKSRKYKCDLCSKSFAVKSALTTHITAVHKEEKTHKCDMCGKSFADSSNLSKHKQIHWRETGGVKKQRSRRNTSTAPSNCSTPSISTPSMEPPTPVAHPYGLQRPASSGYMLPHIAQRAPLHSTSTTLPSAPCCNAPVAAAPASCASAVPVPFDPNCFCCDQQCPPPVGPATPCDETDDCGMDGFCDLPECLGEDGCEECPEPATAVYCCEDQLCGGQASQHWEDIFGAEPHKGFSQMELDEQFNAMGGS
ncbi:zinc-finger protein [Saxophila tyrrhenica]|uniref:Zinc-finger protein n=1 Tax=Saxophila tyrrhenica TaxID=1690608 RepID=A0AAV9P5X1_9PEZI|nr:zinc-finger protein [Saxophila tyrrhenica]